MTPLELLFNAFDEMYSAMNSLPCCVDEMLGSPPGDYECWDDVFDEIEKIRPESCKVDDDDDDDDFEPLTPDNVNPFI